MRIFAHWLKVGCQRAGEKFYSMSILRKIPKYDFLDHYSLSRVHCYFLALKFLWKWVNDIRASLLDWNMYIGTFETESWNLLFSVLVFDPPKFSMLENNNALLRASNLILLLFRKQRKLWIQLHIKNCRSWS